jgi:hypothetical protein
MDFSVFVAVGLFAAGLYIGRRSQRSALNSLVGTADRKTSAAYEANDRYLEVLRREIANLISRNDPEKMIELYRRGKAQEREMSGANKSRLHAELTSLTQKYPAYEDFDKIATKHFVPYSAEKPHWVPEDELPETYLDISKFLGLTRKRDGVQHPVFPDDDDRVLQRCMQELIDRKFRKSLEAAIDKYYVARQVREECGSEMRNYEDRYIGVFRLQSHADVRYGIHLKDTNEYGVYSFFVHDDSKTSTNYSRSDASFGNERALYF